MAANTQPIYTRIGAVGWNPSAIAAVNTAFDGTGTVVTVFTADATNGGRVDRLRVKALGTNVATVMRIFLNNGSTNATPANNTLFGEITIAANTISTTVASTEIDYSMSSALDPSGGLVLQPGYKINITLGATVAAGFAVTAIAGTY